VKGEGRREGGKEGEVREGERERERVGVTVTMVSECFSCLS
jgi:hypothetical protein